MIGLEAFGLVFVLFVVAVPLSIKYQKWQIEKTTKKDEAENIPSLKGNWQMHGWKNYYLKCLKCGTCIGLGDELRCKCDDDKEHTDVKK